MKKVEIGTNVGLRLDKFLQLKFPDFSRSKLQAFIKDGSVRVNKEKKRNSYFLSEGDVLEVKDFKVVEHTVLQKENFDLELIYEDDSCLVINKPFSVVVHPGEGDSHSTGTVVNKVLGKLHKDVLGGVRPGIVHRLDQDTSGLMVVAKTKSAYDDLVCQFKERSVKKSYITLVCGDINPNSGVINSPIGRNVRSRKEMAVVSSSQGKEAVTEYHLKESFVLSEKKFSLLDVELKTGRTHQIRVHMAAIGFPVVADKVYGNRSINKLFASEYGLSRQFLHASELSFVSPGTKKPVSLEIELPVDLNSVLKSST